MICQCLADQLLINDIDLRLNLPLTITIFCSTSSNNFKYQPFNCTWYVPVLAGESVELIHCQPCMVFVGCACKTSESQTEQLVQLLQCRIQPFLKLRVTSGTFVQLLQFLYFFTCTLNRIYCNLTEIIFRLTATQLFFGYFQIALPFQASLRDLKLGYPSCFMCLMTYRTT